MFANPLESNLLSCLLFLVDRYDVADPDMKLMPLYDFKTEHTVFTVPCKALGRSACTNLVVYLLKHKWDGAKAFWSLKAAHGAIVASIVETTSHWIPGRWSSWCTMIKYFGMPSSHMRRSMGAFSGPPSGGIDVPARIFPEFSASTRAFLAILVRLANDGKTKRKDERTKHQWRLALTCFLDRCFAEAPEKIYHVYLDQDIVIEFRIVQGAVDITPFREFTMTTEWYTSLKKRNLALF